MLIKRQIYLISFIVVSAFADVNAQLTTRIAEITKTYAADVGVGIITPEGDTISVNGNKNFPMQSVYKFHVALKIFDMIDKGKLSMKQEVVLTKRDLLSNTWSPLRDSFYVGARVPLHKILLFTVAYSDNNGCDLLFRLAGGPRAVNDYIQAQNVRNVSIQFTEEEMHADWQKQFSNTTTPKAMVTLLDKFNKGLLLKESSTKALTEIMQKSNTGPKRLRGGLPAGTIIAHKTGTSGYKDGVSAATNDAGIVTLPNGGFYSIAVFVGQSKEKSETNEEIISRVSDLVWNEINK